MSALIQLLITFPQLISALPELFQLIKTINAFIKEKELESSVKESVKTINDAFQAKDKEKLKQIFNS